MTNFEMLLSRHTGEVGQSAFATWQHALTLFDDRRYTDAARTVERLLEQVDDDTEGFAPSGATGQAAARLLLARAYYHSAQLGRAIETAQTIVDDDPADSYARVLLARALERAGHSDAAATHRRVAEAMGIDA